MVTLEKFTEQEIPYGKLAEYGLTHNMIEDLPQSAMLLLLAGKPTPVLPILTENQDGKKERSMSRITLKRMEDGSVEIWLAPRWDFRDLKEYSESQQRHLQDGKVIIVDTKDKGLCFSQFDEVTNQVMSVPIGLIRQNLGILEREYNLSTKVAEDVAKCKIAEFDNEGSIATIGIDLEEPSGIRFAKGNAIVWEQEAHADRLPKYNFGIYGCWIADDNNCLSYVDEADYTEEIYAEQRRAGQMRAAGEQMKQMGM